MEHIRLGDNMSTLKKNREMLIDPSKKVGLEVNTEKISTYCYFITGMQGQVIT
jgi:hypothetical protein